MSACVGKQIPAALVEFEGVRAECLLVALRSKRLVADEQLVVSLDGADDSLKVFLARWRTLEHHVLLNRCAVGQHAVNGERGEYPSLNAVVVQHLGIADVVLVGPWFALDDDAEHIKDGVAMTVERRSLQRIAVGHLVVLPLTADFLEGETFVRPERVDDPDVLAEDHCWFHVCKDKKNSSNIQIILKIIRNQEKTQRRNTVTP